MRIERLTIHPYSLCYSLGFSRSGVIVRLFDAQGQCAAGDVAPLPNWSRETLPEAVEEMQRYKEALCSIDWSLDMCLHQLREWNLSPSVSFGLESALLSLLWPVSTEPIAKSAFLMGSLSEILTQAKKRIEEGYTYAKMKVRNLEFAEAKQAILQVKDHLRLRIDVNRAWSAEESLRFFSDFPLDSFDYIEEPFHNPRDLAVFPHPLAIDESFPRDISFEQMEKLPSLKTLVYKPMVQGGLSFYCTKLRPWLRDHQIDCVLSSSFESPLGLNHIAAMARRLSLTSPLGIGTDAFLLGRS